MRLWSIHPKFLDTKGLGACWREALLAQKVLQEKTRGYRSHPQLIRFRKHPRPLVAISYYLIGLAIEAEFRRFNFDISKIGNLETQLQASIIVTLGQLRFEYRHLQRKLTERDVEQKFINRHYELKAHPLFKVIPGTRANWERAKGR